MEWHMRVFILFIFPHLKIKWYAYVYAHVAAFIYAIVISYEHQAICMDDWTTFVYCDHIYFINANVKEHQSQKKTKVTFICIYDDNYDDK